MKKRHHFGIGNGFWALLEAGILLSVSLRAGAAENTELTDTAAVRPEKIAVELPVISENEASPFDFHIDPQRLIYATNAIKFGGGNVEEDATILFHNKDGEYDFSSHSDRLTVRNKGEAPITVAIIVSVEKIEGANLVETKSFDGRNTDVYLALEDENGEELPLMEGNEVRLEQVVDVSQAYSFGLTGACNTDWDWSLGNTYIVVNVSWKVAETDEEAQEDATPEDEDPSVSGEDSDLESVSGGDWLNGQEPDPKQTGENTEEQADNPGEDRRNENQENEERIEDPDPGAGDVSGGDYGNV